MRAVLLPPLPNRLIDGFLGERRFFRACTLGSCTACRRPGQGVVHRVATACQDPIRSANRSSGSLSLSGWSVSQGRRSTRTRCGIDDGVPECVARVSEASIFRDEIVPSDGGLQYCHMGSDAHQRPRLPQGFTTQTICLPRLLFPGHGWIQLAGDCTDDPLIPDAYFGVIHVMSARRNGDGIAAQPVTNRCGDAQAILS